MNDEIRIERILCALDGLSVGDALGGFFEFTHGRIPHKIAHRQLPKPPWRWTDDTQMALATVTVLEKKGFISQCDLVQELVRRYERGRGYGTSTRALIRMYRQRFPLRGLAQKSFNGTGSYGNGSLARAIPVGAFFADDLERAIHEVCQSTAVTHAHPEALAGAVAVTVAAVFACQLQNEPKPNRAEFLQQILPYVPESQTKAGIIQAISLSPTRSATAAAAILGNGKNVSTQDTLPFALWCVGETIGDYEEAVWLTLSGLGDCDTTCAIVGGLVALANGRSAIPSLWLESREPLNF